MTLEYTFDLRTKFNSESYILGTLTDDTDHQLLIQETVVANNSGGAVTVAAAWSNTTVKAIWFQSNEDVTLNFNNNSSPAPAIALKAGKPYLWEATYHANWAAPVTGIFVIPHANNNATLQGRVAYDA